MYGEARGGACLRGLRDGVRGELHGAVLPCVPEETPAGECEGGAALRRVREGVRRERAGEVLPGVPRAEASRKLPAPHAAQEGRAGHRARGVDGDVRDLRTPVRRDGGRAAVLPGLREGGLHGVRPAEEPRMGGAGEGTAATRGRCHRGRRLTIEGG